MTDVSGMLRRKVSIRTMVFIADIRHKEYNENIRQVSEKQISRKSN